MHPLRAAGLETALLWVSAVVMVVAVVAFVVVIVVVVASVLVVVVVVAYCLRRYLPKRKSQCMGSQRRSCSRQGEAYQSLSNTSNCVSEPLGSATKGAANVPTAESTSRVAQRLAQAVRGSSQGLADALRGAVDGLASNRQALADVADSQDALLPDIANSVQGTLAGLANGAGNALERAALAALAALALSLLLKGLLLLLEVLLLLALGEELVGWDIVALGVDLLFLGRRLGCLARDLLGDGLGLRRRHVDGTVWCPDGGLGHLAHDGLLVREAGDLLAAREGGGHLVLGRVPDLLLLFLLLCRGLGRYIHCGGVLDCLLRVRGRLAH